MYTYKYWISGYQVLSIVHKTRHRLYDVQMTGNLTIYGMKRLWRQDYDMKKKPIPISK